VGTNPSVPPATGHRSGNPTSGRTNKKTRVRARIFRELVHIAAEQGATIQLGVSTADALQQCLDRAVALYRFAAAQVDSITLPHEPDPDDPESALANLPTKDDPLFEVIDNPQGPDVIQLHRYYLMEREARVEVEKLAAMMTQLGIAERVVRVQEAQAVLVVAAIREAAIEAGLSQEQIRILGASLRSHLEGSTLRAAQPSSHGDGAGPAASRAAADSARIEKSLPRTPEPRLPADIEPDPPPPY
jgi:hypothetical protein